MEGNLVTIWIWSKGEKKSDSKLFKYVDWDLRDLAADSDTKHMGFLDTIHIKVLPQPSHDTLTELASNLGFLHYRYTKCQITNRIVLELKIRFIYTGTWSEYYPSQ